MSSSSFSAASTFPKQRVACFRPFLLAFLPSGLRAFPIVNLVISLVAVGSSVGIGVTPSHGSPYEAGSPRNPFPGVGSQYLPRGEGVSVNSSPDAMLNGTLVASAARLHRVRESCSRPRLACASPMSAVRPRAAVARTAHYRASATWIPLRAAAAPSLLLPVRLASRTRCLWPRGGHRYECRAGIGLKKGVGVIGLAGVSLSMTASIGAPGPSLFLAAFEPFLGLRTASETSTPFASYVACIFHNVDVATKKLSRHRLPLACCHLQP